MKMVVGLGNPGEQYRRTPHNIGFDVIDLLAQRLGAKLKRSLRFDAITGSAQACGQTVLLVKPQTFMNNSGSAVATLARTKGVALTDILVALDDADLEPGRIRLRGCGGAGGHKGLQSVIAHIGADGFARLRIGIGRDERKNLVEHVLGNYTEQTLPAMLAAREKAVEAAICFLERGIDAAMNDFNARPEAGSEANAEQGG